MRSQNSTNLQGTSRINQLQSDMESQQFLDGDDKSFDQITKQFQNTSITICGTNEDPLFLGKDIARILQIGNISDKTKDFDDRYKRWIRISDITGRLQNQAFYTTKGVYRLAFMSKNEGALKFQDWVMDVIEEIRQNGSYQLKQQNIQYQQREIEYQKERLQYKQKEIEYKRQLKEKDEKLEQKEKYIEIPLLGKIYIGQEFKDTDEYWKVGRKEKKSKRKTQQQNSHTHGYGHFYIQPCINEIHLEKQIQHVLEKQNYHHRGEIYHCRFEFVRAVTRILGSTYDVLYKSRWQMTEKEIRQKINERLDENVEILEDSCAQNSKEDDYDEEDNEEYNEECNENDQKNNEEYNENDYEEEVKEEEQEKDVDNSEQDSYIANYMINQKNKVKRWIQNHIIYDEDDYNTLEELTDNYNMYNKDEQISQKRFQEIFSEYIEQHRTYFSEAKYDRKNKPRNKEWKYGSQQKKQVYFNIKVINKDKQQ